MPFLTEDDLINRALDASNPEVAIKDALLSIAISQRRIADAAEHDAENDARDFFAGLALQGLIAHHGDANWDPKSEIQSIGVRQNSRSNTLMMEARERK